MFACFQTVRGMVLWEMNREDADWYERGEHPKLKIKFNEAQCRILNPTTIS